MNISSWLINATKRLKDIGISSARLDAELILSQTMRKDRTYLHAHLDQTIDQRQIDIADARLSLRLERVPIAYIIGYKEFFGRKFNVSPDVLIPRPESEDMISLFLELTAGDIKPKTLIDIGTGSGCLGITTALERPNLRVILSDVSPAALKIAAKNADELNAKVSLQEQSLLSGQFEPLDYILANLPYVDNSWQVSPETRHEPASALFADKKGLELILKLIEQIPSHLNQNGLALLEADARQHQAIIEFAEQNGLELAAQKEMILALRPISAEPQN